MHIPELMDSSFQAQLQKRKSSSDTDHTTLEVIYAVVYCLLVLLLPIVYAFCIYSKKKQYDKKDREKAKYHGVTPNTYRYHKDYYDRLEAQNLEKEAKDKGEKDEQEKNRREFMARAKGVVSEAIEIPAKVYIPEDV